MFFKGLSYRIFQMVHLAMCRRKWVWSDCLLTLVLDWRDLDVLRHGKPLCSEVWTPAAFWKAWWLGTAWHKVIVSWHCLAQAACVLALLGTGCLHLGTACHRVPASAAPVTLRYSASRGLLWAATRSSSYSRGRGTSQTA